MPFRMVYRRAINAKIRLMYQRIWRRTSKNRDTATGTFRVLLNYQFRIPKYLQGIVENSSRQQRTRANANIKYIYIRDGSQKLLRSICITSSQSRRSQWLFNKGREKGRQRWQKDKDEGNSTVGRNAYIHLHIQVCVRALDTSGRRTLKTKGCASPSNSTGSQR